MLHSDLQTGAARRKRGAAASLQSTFPACNPTVSSVQTPPFALPQTASLSNVRRVNSTSAFMALKAGTATVVTTQNLGREKTIQSPRGALRYQSFCRRRCAASGRDGWRGRVGSRPVESLVSHKHCASWRQVRSPNRSFAQIEAPYLQCAYRPDWKPEPQAGECDTAAELAGEI